MTKIKVGILTVILLISNLVFAQTVQDGRKFLYYQQYNNAKDAFEKALAANPTSLEAQYWLGQAFIGLNQPDKVKELYRKALETNGSNPLLLVAMGHVELVEGKQSEARQRFETAISLMGKKLDVTVLNAIGRANLDKNGDADFGIEKLNLATTVKGFKEPDVYITMGDLFRKKNDGGGAVKSYQNALVLDPKYAVAKYKTGKVYLTQGKDQETVFMQHFNDAIADDPNFAPAYYDAYVFFFARDVNKAKEYFNFYKNLAEKGPALDYESSSLLFASSDFKGAVAKADELLLQYGANADNRLYRLKGYSFYKLGDSIQAITALETFFSKANAEQIVVDNWLVAAELSAKIPARSADFDKYITNAIASDTLMKGKIDAAKKAMDIFKKAGNQAKVAEWAEKILTINPTPTKVEIYNAGFENFKATKYLKADSIFTIYKTKYPDEVYGHYWSFRALSVVDSTMEGGLAIPSCQRFIELAELDKVKNKSTLLTAYGYMASYNANMKKDYETAIGFLDRIIAIDPANADATKNKEILQKALAKPATKSTKAG
jgi:tetratricopeptide (TPR) repeat protein